MKGISSLSLHRLDSTWDMPAILDAFLEGARKKLELAQQTASQAPFGGSGGTSIFSFRERHGHEDSLPTGLCGGGEGGAEGVELT